MLGHFCCAKEATQPEADEQKKDNGFIYSIHYKREVYCERTVQVERFVHNLLLAKGKNAMLSQIVPSTEIYLTFKWNLSARLFESNCFKAL